ncbi:MAG: DNA polymerase IV [Alphaproteobacteria bacterium]|nr:DNA polymerase IV [Alphaproteobacteria bacterium]
MRKILHVDMDAFYASVEQRDDPTLRGRPVAVGGDPEGRGVVAAASYEARRYGVRSAMAAAHALKLCPDLIFVRGSFTKYRAVSQQMHAIFADYTDQIEAVALDEAYLDVSENRAGLPFASQVAVEIRRRIRDELDLTASAGVAPVKFAAKIASDHRKPDGLTVIPPERLLAFLHPLPVRKLPGVGPSTETRIRGLGIHTIGDVARRDLRELERRLGSRGAWLWRMANGEDPRRVVGSRVRKSRGSERTFDTDVTDAQRLLDFLAEQTRGLCEGLQRSEEKARTVTLKIRYADFTTITRASTLPQPTDSAEDVLPEVQRLLAKTDAGTTPVRLAGITFSNFAGEGEGPVEQLDLPFRPVWSIAS